jgi:hypothetical protein
VLPLEVKKNATSPGLSRDTLVPNPDPVIITFAPVPADVSVEATASRETSAVPTGAGTDVAVVHMTPASPCRAASPLSPNSSGVSRSAAPVFAADSPARDTTPCERPTGR